MARSARGGLSAGMSTRVTSGLAVRTRRVTGSDAATGKLAQLWIVRATLVPSTSTCSTARCSLSVATITTDSSGITNLRFLFAFVEPAVVQERPRILGRGRRLRTGRDTAHRAQNHKFRIA